ncbi:sigma-54-dependent Fis family transcriptional regulator [candidate division KSB1 bacterium]|nr:sigma-54-dependent Fis family transcriptional regulator [candidate division KSB1 bacterium]
MAFNILIIDDDASIRKSLSELLGDQGYEVKTVQSGEEAFDMLAHHTVDMAFLDVMLPGIDGLEVLKKIKRGYPVLTVVMISGHADLSMAVQATKLGAYDFIEKPLKAEKVLLSAKNVYDKSIIENEVNNLKMLVDLDYRLIGNTPVMIDLYHHIKKAAPSDSRIMILGENGTGKELVAREVHKLSLRADKPFIKLNCAALPKELIESELFGYERGAFTGADKRKTGLIEEANHGTLFLDEVGDMSLETQAKLLRVLQENEFKRVGGNQSISFDVRIVSATNKNLDQLIKNNEFREDLYFRLNVIPIRVPALKERTEDIPLLADYFLKAYSVRNNKKIKTMSQSAKYILMKYDWPGNVRELKNLIERLVIMTDDDEINALEVAKHLNEVQQFQLNDDQDLKSESSLKERLMRFERRILQEEYSRSRGNITKMADHLSTDRANLSRKLKKFGITDGG